MNKTKYEFAEMEIVMVDNTDVICTSDGSLDVDDAPTTTDPNDDPFFN